MIDFTQAWIATLQRVTASTLVTHGAATTTFAPINLDTGVLSIRGAAKLASGRGSTRCEKGRPVSRPPLRPDEPAYQSSSRG